MDRPKLPVGIDNFEKLRTEGFYYVDKTSLIKELLSNWGEANLFTRPRRFGKTLNMSMLKNFFEIGCDKSLFDGLAIMKEKGLCDAYMGKYPVVFVSLKGVDGLTFEDAYGMLRKIIRAEVSRLYFLNDSDHIIGGDKMALERIFLEEESKNDIIDSLKMLTQLLHKHYGQQVILLIDEYDVPLDKAFQRGYYDEMVDLIRGMFHAAMKTNDSLYFAVMTGCLRVSKESIFTGLNNPVINAITDERYDEYFGFTDAEVRKMLTDYDLMQHYDAIKEWYDGYRFGSVDVYCPWDVISHCYTLQTSPDAEPKAYWMNTSGNDMVRGLIDAARVGTAQMEIEKLIAGESIRKRLSEQLTHDEINKDINNIWSLLFMTGYLTTTQSPKGGIYELVIPNREVREIYIEKIRAWFEDRVNAETNLLGELYRAFETGDAETIERILNEQLLSTISYYDAQESFYHGFLLALLNTCADWYVISNAETGRGRSDILVERTDRKLGFVVEVKDVKEENKMEDACAAALRQIEDRDYTAPLRKYRVPHIWMYGIAFCYKTCKVVAKQILM